MKKSNNSKLYLRASAALIASMAFAAPVAAADLFVQEDVVAYEGPVGSIEGGGFRTGRTSTDTDIEDSPFWGGYLAGQVQTNWGQFRASIDGRYEFISDGGLDDVDQSGPVHTGVVGAHLGYEFGQSYVGAFGAAGFFDGYDSEDPMTGALVGLEASQDLPIGAVLYGQLGFINAIGDPDDNEFVGYVARIGVNHQFTSKIKAGASVEFGGTDDCFVDCGGSSSPEPANFTMYTIDGSIAATESLDFVARISHLSVVDDEDSGEETNFYVGLRWNFGPRSEQTALTTPMGGFQAAGWMHPLD